MELGVDQVVIVERLILVSGESAYRRVVVIFVIVLCHVLFESVFRLEIGNPNVGVIDKHCCSPFIVVVVLAAG